ncbi:hypothetical protein M404DRAFT_910943 [Pisolithus tinctorius Marx 270]|uniref:Uncharacterized protein n=1 Tax=Pisolithus tinctorius Marx 270 TaxID=870435 RepID=A0A0C3PNS3_PISTI|nr:hypothetical protein M404DRAFT_910943 [Pisolithus tinctorius Marx 270]
MTSVSTKVAGGVRPWCSPGATSLAPRSGSAPGDQCQSRQTQLLIDDSHTSPKKSMKQLLERNNTTLADRPGLSGWHPRMLMGFVTMMASLSSCLQSKVTGCSREQTEASFIWRNLLQCTRGGVATRGPCLLS